MGHVVPVAPASLTAGGHLLHAAVLSAIPTDSTLSGLDAHEVGSAFKRPHDPPHLHTHILLI
jgi:hypothetical protein